MLKFSTEYYRTIAKDTNAEKTVADLCDEIDRLRGKKQVRSQGKTVEVRVAVAVDRNGHWSANGWQGASADQARDAASEIVAEGECIYWLTATLPVPAEVTVVARVEGE